MGSIPVMAIGFAQSYESFLLFRLAIGVIGASFVITQYHTSVMFARNRISTMILGVILVGISLILWNHSLEFLNQIPKFLLGSLLAYVGLHHALLVRDVVDKYQTAILAVGVGVVSYVLRNPALGLGFGLAIQFLIKFSVRLKAPPLKRLKCDAIIDVK